MTRAGCGVRAGEQRTVMGEIPQTRVRTPSRPFGISCCARRCSYGCTAKPGGRIFVSEGPGGPGSPCSPRVRYQAVARDDLEVGPGLRLGGLVRTGGFGPRAAARSSASDRIGCRLDSPGQRECRESMAVELGPLELTQVAPGVWAVLLVVGSVHEILEAGTVSFAAASDGSASGSAGDSRVRPSQGQEAEVV